MAAKKTIAIIASSNERATAVTDKLSLGNYSLLLLSKYANQFEQLLIALQSAQPGTEFEIIDCMKDGCWEADIIVLDIPQYEEEKMAELIREVSIQKVVVSFSQNKNEFESDELQNLLQHSKIVKALTEVDTSATSLRGKDESAVSEISEIFKNSKQNTVITELSNY